MRFFYIFLGGGIGSVLRYLASVFVGKNVTLGAFPLGTFLVNIVGCFFIGLFSAFFVRADHPMRFLLVTGLCGGFTTFSTFSSENFSLMQSGNLTVAALYSFASIILGIAFVFFGFRFAANFQ